MASGNEVEELQIYETAFSNRALNRNPKSFRYFTGNKRKAIKLKVNEYNKLIK